jgi:hypothetical protein
LLIKVFWAVLFFFLPRDVSPILVREENRAEAALPQVTRVTVHSKDVSGE